MDSQAVELGKEFLERKKSEGWPQSGDHTVEGGLDGVNGYGV